MKAVILAAGIGSRMGKIAKEIPKCLIKIDNKPIIKKQIESLHSNDITDISIVVGYRSDMVRNTCESCKVKFYTNPRFKETGMLESLFCAHEELNDEFILVYGDVYFEKEVIEKLLLNKSDFCLAVDKSKTLKKFEEEFYEEYHGSKMKKGSTKVHVIDEMVKKISKNLEINENDGEYIGIAKFSERGTKIIYEMVKRLIDSSEIAKFPSPSYLFRELIKNGQKFEVIFVDPHSYSEIDYSHDINEAKKLFEKNEIRGILLDAEDVIYFRDEETLMPIIDFFKKEGFPITVSEFREAYEKYKLDAYKGKISKDEHLRKTLDNLNIKHDDMFFDGFKKIFRKSYSNIKIKKQIKSLFVRLKERGLKIGILTDTFSSENSYF